jgi:hypothetical protein
MSEPEYFFEKAPTDHEAFFSFKGHFQHASVTWHVHLLTCYSRIPRSATQQAVIRQFIDIEKGRQAGHYHAQICLNIPRVSHAAIIKTMIMIQQYKNLATGRHEYGEPVQLPADM